jgi:hypothetical protein
MLKKDWLNLPEDIRMFVAVDAEQFTDEIVDKFVLTVDQKMYIFDLEDKLFLKQISPLDIPAHLDKMPESKNSDVRLLTLDIAYKILWPLQDYIGDVDKLILRLGGKVPRIKPLKGKLEDQSKIFPGQAQGTVKEMMDKYQDFKELRLSSNKIIDSRGYHLTATVDNWIKDYIHFIGVEGRDSLKRAQYLSKAKNPLSISAADRDSLRLLLVSYDDDVPMSFDYNDLSLKVTDLEEKKAIVESAGATTSLEESIKDLENKFIEIEKNIIAANLILSEAGGEMIKVRDILWNALAMSDKDKVLSCLKFLLEKKAFDLMLREDARFRSILKRFIGIRFGRSAENYLVDNPDVLIVRRLFLEMILSEKLRLKETEAATFSYYLTNLVPSSGQLVYFDESTSSLKWRQVEALGNKISWSEVL